MKTRRPRTTTLVRLVLTAVLAGGVLAAAPPAGATTPPPSPMAASPVTGVGHATAHSVTIGGALTAPLVPAPTGAASPLGRDGRPTGSALPAVASAAAPAVRPTPTDPAHRAGGPNNGQPGTTAPSTANPAASPAATTAGIQGVTQGNSGCPNCSTPDVTAAVNATQIAETVNLRLQVVTKSGGSLCSVSLTSLLGAVTGLAGPRIQYDNANKRFSMVIDSVPASSSDVPIQYLATSQTDNACGAWWIYSIIFSGTGYPLGTLVDFPYLGQDNTSILSSTNNFAFGGSYLGSAAYAMPKSIAYTGDPFSFNTYSVAFSTAPVTVAGIPIAATTNTYWLAAVPGTGYNLYVMPTNPAGAISLRATINSPFSAPTRRVHQPGTTQTLDPLDGRLGSAAMQDGNVIWFAHDVDDQGFPTVRYGGINVSTGQISTAVAFQSTGSDDFNPSIGVFPGGGGTDFIWLNWAYTQASAGVPTSNAVAGVGAGQGVPDLAGNDLTLVSGSITTSNSGFGRYSSVEIDPVAASSSCAAGLTALTAQEFFTSGGQWTTELARTTFC